jgi:hypothetical protein
LIRVGVGLAVRLGFRDVLVGLLLRFLDGRVRPRRVCLRDIALDVSRDIRVDRSFDTGTPVAARVRDRRLDGNFVLRMGPMSGHGKDPFVQRVDLRRYSCKRRAKAWRPACVTVPGIMRPFYKRSVVYFNTDCKSCRRASAQ